MSEPETSETEPRVVPMWFWLVMVGGLISLGGGGTLLYLSQSGSLGIGSGDGPGLPSESYVAQQHVDIWKNESWHAGSVVSVDGDHYRVHYDQSKVFPDETVDATRLQEHAQ